jgi:hypothetical protein
MSETALAEIYSVRYECVFRPADKPGHFGNRPENMKRMVRAGLDHIKRLDDADGVLRSLPDASRG